MDFLFESRCVIIDQLHDIFSITKPIEATFYFPKVASGVFPTASIDCSISAQ